MCAHFESPDWKLVTTSFPGNVQTSTSSFTTDVWPGRQAPFLLSSEAPRWVHGCFGMMPFWAKPTHYRHSYNARSETIAEKPTFRHAWKNGQFCAVPATAFFEPCYESGRAQAHRIEPLTKRPFWLAGLWDCFHDSFNQDVWSFTLITINAEHHPLMSRYHGLNDEKWSVVVLPQETVIGWLNAPTQGNAQDFLTPFAATEFVGRPV